MKKIIICITFILLLVGCKKPEVGEPPRLNNISFDVAVTYYNENYLLKATLDENGGLTLTINEPSELEGMQLSFFNDEISISYKGLTYTPANNALPLPVAADMIYSAIKAVSAENVRYEYNDKSYNAIGKHDNREFVMSFSPSGYPISLEYLSDAFFAEFSNISDIKNE